LMQNLGGARVLLPRSDLASDRLPEALAERGALVTAIVAYRNRAIEALTIDQIGRLRSEPPEGAFFASPSAVSSIAAALRAAGLEALLESMKLVSIGPTTSKRIQELGFEVAAEAAAPSTAEVLVALGRALPRR